MNPTHVFILAALFSSLWQEEEVSVAAAPTAPVKKFLSFTDLSISYPSFSGQWRNARRSR